MSTIECSIFDGINHAAGVVSALSACGFSSEDLSLVVCEHENMSMTSSSTMGAGPSPSSQAQVFEDNPRRGLLVAHSILVDGIGTVLVTGSFASVLVGTRYGLKATNLINALTALHVPGTDVDSYAEAVRRGGSLLLINAPDHMLDRVQDILLLHNVVDLSQRAQRWRQQGWKYFDPHGLPYTNEELNRERLQQANEERRRCDFHPYDRDFRSHYYLTDVHGNEPYEYYASAYHYGYRLVYDRDYHGKEWPTVESRARRQWERQEGQPWEAISDAVYYGFVKGQYHNRAWKIPSSLGNFPGLNDDVRD